MSHSQTREPSQPLADENWQVDHFLVVNGLAGENLDPSIDGNVGGGQYADYLDLAPGHAFVTDEPVGNEPPYTPGQFFPGHIPPTPGPMPPLPVNGMGFYSAPYPVPAPANVTSAPSAPGMAAFLAEQRRMNQELTRLSMMVSQSSSSPASTPAAPSSLAQTPMSVTVMPGSPAGQWPPAALPLADDGFAPVIPLCIAPEEYRRRHDEVQAVLRACPPRRDPAMSGKGEIKPKNKTKSKSKGKGKSEPKISKKRDPSARWYVASEPLPPLTPLLPTLEHRPEHTEAEAAAVRAHNLAAGAQKIDRCKERNNQSAARSRVRRDKLEVKLKRFAAEAEAELHFWKMRAVSLGASSGAWEALDPLVRRERIRAYFDEEDLELCTAVMDGHDIWTLEQLRRLQGGDESEAEDSKEQEEVDEEK